MSAYYILRGKEIIPVADVIEWAKWFEEANCRVDYTQITPDIEVSTVFLGIDHNCGRVGKPLLFKTMVFGGSLDEEQERYSTWDEAEQGHEQMVEKVRQAI